MPSAPISDVLSYLGLSQYVERFEEAGFDDWETVLEITESDLDILGVESEHRNILREEISLAKNKKPETSVIEWSTTKRGYRLHPEPDRNAPERPNSAYKSFSNKIREDFKFENLSFTELSKKVQEIWQILTAEEKESYHSQASAAWERYKGQLSDYLNTKEHREYQRYLKDFNTAQHSRQQSDSDLLGVSYLRLCKDHDSGLPDENSAWNDGSLFDEGSRLPKLSLDPSIPSTASDFESTAAYLEAPVSLAHVGSFARSPLEEDASPSPVYFAPTDTDFHNAGSHDQSAPPSSNQKRHYSFSEFYPWPRENPLPAIAVGDPKNTVAMKRARNTMAAVISRKKGMNRAELLANLLETNHHWMNLALLCKQRGGTEDEFISHWTGLEYTQHDANSDPGVEDCLKNRRIESWEGDHPPYNDNVLPNVKIPRSKPPTSIRPSHEASTFTEEAHSSVSRSSVEQDDSKIVAIPEITRSDNGITTISSEERSARPVDFFDVSSSSPEAMTKFVAAAGAMNDGSSKARKRTKTACLTCRKRRIKCDEKRPSCQNCERSALVCERSIPRFLLDPFSMYSPAQGFNHAHTQDLILYVPSSPSKPLSELFIAPYTAVSYSVDGSNYHVVPELPTVSSNTFAVSDAEGHLSISELPQMFADPPKAPSERTEMKLQPNDSDRVSEVKTSMESEPLEKALSVTVKVNLGMVESQVLHGLSFWAPGASLKMQWNLLDFMENQYANNEDAKLGSVITLSGTVQKAQATTCSEYVEHLWPSQGSTVIRAFQSAIDSRDHKAQATNSEIEIEVQLERGSCFLSVQSKNPKVIAEVFQQAIWMGTALRASSNEQVQYSNFCLTALPTWDQSLFTPFSVTFDTSELPEDEQSCWLPLFANPVIAQGFPVSRRENGEQGLEIPLEIMAALGGARHVTDFQGGLVLKGHSTSFVPVRRHHQSIQWHLIRRSGEHRILYREVVEECPKRAMLEEVDHESLRTTRAFLGWWKNAETHLGTADAAYDRIDWSPTSETRRSARISGANLGFQTMITGQLSFIMGAKDGRLHFSQKGPFQRIVQCAERTPIVLYDSVDRRAWLIPGLDLMLHIVQTRHCLSPYNIDGKNVELTPVIPENGRGAAPEAIAANKSRQLYERDVAMDKCYYFKDAILDVWSQMERLMEKEDVIEAHAGMALHGTMQSKIQGWEYMSLVHEKNYRRKEAAIAKSSGGWVDLINDIDALVLFATGFDEIIKPVSDLNNLCLYWRSLPKGKDYLAAGVRMLELLYSEAGSRHSRKHLTTTHLQWHRGSTLFEPCFFTRPDRCGCDRTQRIYHDSLFSAFGRVRPPGTLEEDGCVIFGQVHHSLKPIKTLAIRENAIHMLPNTSIQDSAIGKDVLIRDDGIHSLSPPASFSPEREEVNGYAVRSPKRPPSPMSFNDEPLQEETVTRKRRRRISHVPTPIFDSCKGPNNSDHQSSPSDDSFTLPLTAQSVLRHDTASTEQCAGIAETVCLSKAEYAPVHAPKTIRHKANIENYSHRHGCTCTICSTVKFEPPDSIEFVPIINGARSNSPSIAERRQQQPV